VTGLRRRDLLRAAVLGAGGLWLGLAGCGGRDARPALRELARRLPPQALQIGVRFRAHDPERALAAADVVASRPRWRDAPVDDPDAVARLFAEQVREDFREGRTVELDGWILSESETCLCALALAAGPA